MRKARTLEALHTHTHTHTHYILKEKNNIRTHKDLYLLSISLVCLFVV